MAQTFGAIVRDLRRAHGLSQGVLAREVQVDVSYISKVERERLPPPAAETIVKWAEALGVPAEALLVVTGKMPCHVTAMLGSSRAALHFVQQAHRMGLTEAEWQYLAQQLQALRRI